MTLRLLAFTLLLGSATALAEHPLSNPRVYLGKNGVRVLTASAKGASGDRCVLWVTGIQNELEDLVLDCRAERQDARITYWIVRQGRDDRAMRTEGNGLAELGGPSQLEYSELESNKVNLEAVWARHQAQVASGQLGAITRFDRAAETSVAVKEVTAAGEVLNRTCAQKLKFTFDWAGASDELFKSPGRLVKPQHDCFKAIDTMKEMCARWKIVRSTFAEKLTEVRCTFTETEAPKISLNGTILSVGTNPLSVTMPGDLERFLKEAL